LFNWKNIEYIEELDFLENFRISMNDSN